MRIVVITANSERHKYFCHLVSNEFGHLFTGIVNQKSGSTKTRSRKHESFKDKSSRIINIMLNNPKMFLQKLNNKIQSKLNPFKRIPPQKRFSAHWKDVGFPEVPIHMTYDVNSETTVKAIKDMKPDLIMVFGGKILKSTIIDIPKEKYSKLKTGLSIGRRQRAVGNLKRLENKGKFDENSIDKSTGETKVFFNMGVK